VLDKLTAPDLRVYAVWVPILWSDWRLAVSRATTRLPDERVSHFWDAGGTLVRAYSQILQLSDARPAWDVYLLFDRNAEWNDEPPAPQDWMHQLPREPAERRLDSEALAAKAGRLLDRDRKAPGTARRSGCGVSPEPIRSRPQKARCFAGSSAPLSRLFGRRF